MKRALVLALALLAVGALRPAAADPLHFGLARTAPAADSTVHHVEEVRLWFTAVPQANATSIRVVGEDGEARATGPVTSDAQDGRVHAVRLGAALAPGRYTVVWRSMADDGHVVRGDFGFTVADH